MELFLPMIVIVSAILMGILYGGMVYSYEKKLKPHYDATVIVCYNQ